MTITGSGWQPGETVNLIIHETLSPVVETDETYTAVADSYGRILNTELIPNVDDAGVRFYLTASGINAQAQTTFTDAPKVGSVNVGAQSPNPVTAGNSATYTITVNRGSGSGSSGNFTATLSITTALPAGAIATFSPNPVGLVPSATSATSTLTITTLGSTPAGTTSFTVKAATSASDFASNDGTLVVQAACTATEVTTNPINQTIVYGNNATFTAAASGSPTPTVQWEVNSGTGWTPVSGATSLTLSINQPTVSQSGNQYRAIFTNSCSGTQTATTTAATLTVSPKPASVTPNAASKTYGDVDPALTGTLNGFLAADGVTATYSRTAGETVAASPYTISAVLSPAAILTNYTITYNTAHFTITRKSVTPSVTASDKTYDGTTTATATCSLTGVLAADTAAVTCSAASATFASPNAGTHTVTATGISLSGSASGNYELSATTATTTAKIDPKPASVTPNAASKTYGDADPALTGVLSGFIPADGVTATYSRTAGETVAGSPYTISAVLSPAAVLTNYTITYNTALFTISPEAGLGDTERGLEDVWGRGPGIDRDAERVPGSRWRDGNLQPDGGRDGSGITVHDFGSAEPGGSLDQLHHHLQHSPLHHHGAADADNTWFES